MPAKDIIHTRLLLFSFLTFWHYDILHELAFLRNAGVEPHTLSEVIVYATVVSGF
jgi:hypothetical protein